MWPVLLLLLLDSSQGSPAPPEDDAVEHRVTSLEARRALDHASLAKLMGEGCKPCTERQRGYCLSEDLLSDHCICDHRLNERLPYKEHTCYLPNRFQPMFATDCHEYVRLLECCCHAVLLPLLKDKSRNANSSRLISTSPLQLQKVIELIDGVKEKASSGSSTSRLASLLLPVVIALRWTSALITSTSFTPIPS